MFISTRRSMFDVRCSMFDVRPVFDVQRSMFVQYSTFNVRCSMFDVRPVLDVRCSMFDVRCSSSTRRSTFDVRCSMFIQYSTLNLRCPMFDVHPVLDVKRSMFNVDVRPAIEVGCSSGLRPVLCHHSRREKGASDRHSGVVGGSVHRVRYLESSQASRAAGGRKPYGVRSPQGTVPAVLHRDVGASGVLHDRRHPVVVCDGRGARGARPAGLARQRDLRAVPGVRVLHAVSRRHDRRPVPGLSAGRVPRRVADGGRVVLDGHAGLSALHAGLGRADHRQRFLQAQHLRDGRQPVRAGRPPARCRVSTFSTWASTSAPFWRRSTWRPTVRNQFGWLWTFRAARVRLDCVAC